MLSQTMLGDSDAVTTRGILGLIGVMAGLAGLAGLPGCGGDGAVNPLGPLSCGGLGSDATAQKTMAFLGAAANFKTQSEQVAQELNTACVAMATDLNQPVMPPTGNQQPVEASCGALATAIDMIAQTELAGPPSLILTVEPAQCYLDAGATANCVAMCDAQFMATGMVQCQPGQVRGMCNASCMGKCHMEGSVVCAGECRGLCNGECTGECNGSCAGTCSVMDASGNCIGQCTGTCNGSCSGECVSPMCMGNCVSTVNGMCTGTCEGSCSAEFMAPQCSGEPMIVADGQCKAACNAELRAQAVCTKPNASVRASGVNLMNTSKVANLVSTLQRNWPQFLSGVAKLQGLQQAGMDLQTAAQGLADSIKTTVPAAFACLTNALTDLATAVGNVSASVRVSVQVSASVTATTADE
ncbi:MAG: hypothetical protein MJD61_18375 [Proteobacteria bacterium]|nr:hypothetical protein [Pseudomonadota bacterium]